MVVGDWVSNTVVKLVSGADDEGTKGKTLLYSRQGESVLKCRMKLSVTCLSVCPFVLCSVQLFSFHRTLRENGCLTVSRFVAEKCYKVHQPGIPDASCFLR